MRRFKYKFGAKIQAFKQKIERKKDEFSNDTWKFNQRH